MPRSRTDSSTLPLRLSSSRRGSLAPRWLTEVEWVLTTMRRLVAVSSSSTPARSRRYASSSCRVKAMCSHWVLSAAAAAEERPPPAGIGVSRSSPALSIPQRPVKKNESSSRAGWRSKFKCQQVCEQDRVLNLLPDEAHLDPNAASSCPQELPGWSLHGDRSISQWEGTKARNGAEYR